MVWERRQREEKERKGREEIAGRENRLKGNVEKTAREENRTGRGKLRQIKREKEGQEAGGHKVKDRKEDGGSVSNWFP